MSHERTPSTIAIALSIGAFTLGSCAPLPPDQQGVLDVARSLNHFPVRRAEVIKDFGLSALPSDRDGMVMNSGYFFTESWCHPCGLIVTGHDGAPIEPKYFTRETIDRMLMSSERPLNAFGYDSRVPRATFERLVISSNRGRTLFDSGEKQ